jgi:RNA polymerase sigma-70 factor (ECF subfamily)
MSPGKTQGTQPDRTWFATTHWSVVLAAKDRQDAAGRQALETLCRTYWYPLYAYVRKRGYGRQDAEDLTQEFFSHLLAKERLGRVTRDKGKFRSFLLASLNHFLVDQWKRASAGKRGVQQTFRLDWDTAETRFQQEPVVATTPEMIFEQNWPWLYWTACSSSWKENSRPWARPQPSST